MGQKFYLGQAYITTQLKEVMLMLRNLLSNRYFLGVVIIFVLAIAGCLYWHQHEMRKLREIELGNARFLQEIETNKAAYTARHTEQTDTEILGQADTPFVTDNFSQTETLSIDEVDNVGVMEELLQEETAKLENTDAPVSPHGFGPYPDVPNDYPLALDPYPTSFWKFTYDDPKQELLARTLIKLWKQGVPVAGATFENGVIYPTIRGTVYVERNGDFINRIAGHPDDDHDEIISTLEAGSIPMGITVIDRAEAGIDPYAFLDLR